MPIDKHTLDDRVATDLRTRISSGELAPGARLTEVALAEGLGVSRGTVRAALQRLTQEQLVDRVPYSGWSVSALSPDDAWDLFTLRSALESAAAWAAAQRPVDVGVETLEASFRKMEDPYIDGATGWGIADADLEFHRATVMLSANRRLVAHCAVIEPQLRRYLAASDALLAGAGVIVKQHAPILSAVRDRHAELAHRLAREHVLESGARLVDSLRHRPPPSNSPSHREPRELRHVELTRDH